MRVFNSLYLRLVKMGIKSRGNESIIARPCADAKAILKNR